MCACVCTCACVPDLIYTWTKSSAYVHRYFIPWRIVHGSEAIPWLLCIYQVFSSYRMKKEDVDAWTAGLDQHLFQLETHTKDLWWVCSPWTAATGIHCLARWALVEFHIQKHAQSENYMCGLLRDSRENTVVKSWLFKRSGLVWQWYQSRNMTPGRILRTGQSWPLHSSTAPELQ